MSEIESPRYPPVFTLIDDPRDPENAQRLEEAERFRRDNPSGLIFHRLIVRPPRGKSNWANVSRKERERYLAALQLEQHPSPGKVSARPELEFAAQIDRLTPFRSAQIPDVIASLQVKVAQLEPWVKGNATALQSKRQTD